MSHGTAKQTLESESDYPYAKFSQKGALAVDGTVGTLNIVAIVAAVASFCVNVWLLTLFLIRSYRSKPFFSGQWRGEIEDEKGHIDCVAVFYVDHGQLAGHIYYHGPYTPTEYVHGFDRLLSDSTKFRKAPAKEDWGRVTKLQHRCYGVEFAANFKRVLHGVNRHDGAGCLVATNADPYEYVFSVHTRVRNPRLTCTVSSRPNADGEIRTFSGELVKQGGISRLGAR